jgi:predicted CoA-binding protein
MTSAYERFWEQNSFIVVGDSASKDFPVLTYQGLKKMGKTVTPVDLSGKPVDGDESISSIDNLQSSNEAAILELPPEKTEEIVTQLASKGIRKVWIHQGTDTPEALEAAQVNGLEVVCGNCAVMYVNCTSFHKIHRWIWRLIGKY